MPETYSYGIFAPRDEDNQEDLIKKALNNDIEALQKLMEQTVSVPKQLIQDKEKTSTGISAKMKEDDLRKLKQMVEEEQKRLTHQAVTQAKVASSTPPPVRLRTFVEYLQEVFFNNHHAQREFLHLLDMALSSPTTLKRNRDEGNEFLLLQELLDALEWYISFVCPEINIKDRLTLLQKRVRDRVTVEQAKDSLKMRGNQWTITRTIEKSDTISDSTIKHIKQGLMEQMRLELTKSMLIHKIMHFKEFEEPDGSIKLMLIFNTGDNYGIKKTY